MIQNDPEIMKLTLYQRRQIRAFNPFNIWGPTLMNSGWSYIHTGHGSKDVGNGKNQRRGGLLANFTTRWPLDGLHNLRYKVERIIKHPLFTTVHVDFSRQWDVPNEEKKAVNMTDLILSHPCLQNLDILMKCHYKEW